MTGDPTQNEFLSRKVIDWLFLLLRFAITRDENDRAAVCALARQMDSLGVRFGLADQGFFQRTSADICQAIIEPDSPRSFALLRTHAQRIEHPRLRNCFRSAVDLAEIARVPKNRARKRAAPANLWDGLRSSCAANPLGK